MEPCEQDILARKFVEHGEYEKAYYGTSIQAIRAVVSSEKICVLNLHPQARGGLFLVDTQCCGSGMFIPDPTFFHPGSELFPSRIRIKEFKYFNNKKMVFKL